MVEMHFVSTALNFGLLMLSDRHFRFSLLSD